MSITILTPYRLFFVDESEYLFALMKDGRVRKIKKIGVFPSLSADFESLGSVDFDGETSHIYANPLHFDTGVGAQVASFFGYFYFPTMTANHKKIAVLRRDLLHTHPSGLLGVYQKSHKNWKRVDERLALISQAPAWNKKGDTLFYVNPDYELIKSFTNDDVLARGVLCFAIAPLQSEIAYYADDNIHIYSLVNHQEKEKFRAAGVTALAFDRTSGVLYYAVNMDGRYVLYAYERASQQSKFLAQNVAPILLLST